MDARGTVAAAMAIRGEKIIRTGSDSEIRALEGGATRAIDLQGRVVLPGFIDTHIHLDCAAVNTKLATSCHIPPVDYVEVSGSTSSRGAILDFVKQKAQRPVAETVPDEFQDEAVPEEYEDPFENEGFEDPFEEKKQAPPLYDPWEGFNRAMYAFNDNLYEYLLRPVAESYRDYVHEDLRIGLGNVYNVFLAPSKIVSCMIQGKWEKSGIVLARTAINLTLGFGGMADVAGEEYGLLEVNEDFGQALGFRGVPSGPYLMLPWFGPSSARDAVGSTVDIVLNPLFWLVPDIVAGMAVSGGRFVNDTSFRVEDIKSLKETAIDPYESIRHFYNELRERAVRD